MGRVQFGWEVGAAVSETGVTFCLICALVAMHVPAV